MTVPPAVQIFGNAPPRQLHHVRGPAGFLAEEGLMDVCLHEAKVRVGDFVALTLFHFMCEIQFISSTTVLLTVKRKNNTTSSTFSKNMTQQHVF